MTRGHPGTQDGGEVLCCLSLGRSTSPLCLTSFLPSGPESPFRSIPPFWDRLREFGFVQSPSPRFSG